MRVLRYCSIVLLVAGLLCVVQVGSQLFPAGAQPAEKGAGKTPGVENHQLDGIYFGSSDTQFGHSAWFLSLEAGQRRGKLYMPPGVLELKDVKISEAGRITFRTEAGIGDVLYQFEGEPGPKGISGRFDFIRAEPGTAEEVFAKAEVTLEKVNLPVANQQSRNVSGVYSNVGYSARGEDLTGQQLILFSSATGWQGIFMWYEDLEPLALTNVTLTGANLKFRVRGDFGEQNYSGTFYGNRIQLRRTDPNVSPSFSKIILSRKGDVRSLFAVRRQPDKQQGSR